MGGLDISTVTQVGFSIAVCWYLLNNLTKKMDDLSTLVRDTQKENLYSTKELKEMFLEIRDLIKETSNLVRNTSEGVHVQNEVMTAILNRIDHFPPRGA